MGTSTTPPGVALPKGRGEPNRRHERAPMGLVGLSGVVADHLGHVGLEFPAGSSPDEDYYLTTAWCSHGTRPGLCAPGSTPTTRIVPASLDNVSCYAGSPKSNGSCPASKGMVETIRGNFTGAGPSGFAWVMGLFAGPAIGTSVLMMRLFNALIHVLGLTALLWLAATGRRASYLLTSLVTVVPLGLFTIASANPSSWAVTSAFLTWAGAVELGRTLSQPQRHTDG